LFKRTELTDVMLEGRFGRNALRVTLGVDGAAVHPAGKSPEPRAFNAIPPHQVAFLSTLQICNRAEAVGREFGRADRPNAVDEADRFFCEECRGLGLPQNGEAARLIKV